MADTESRPLSQVYEEEVRMTLSLFRGNHGLPPPPTRTDLEAIKTRIERLHGETIKVARSHNIVPNKQEREAAQKSFAAAAVLDLMDKPRIGPEPTKEPMAAIKNSIHPPAPESLANFSTESAQVGIPNSRASDVLSHLVFSRAAKTPEPVWHPKWKLKRVLAGHTGWVRCVDVDPSNEWFVTGGNDRLIKIWDLASGTLKLTLTGHVHSVRALVLSERHPYLFSCGEDNTVKCWDLEANKVVRHFHGHLSGVYALALHPSVDVLASGGRDCSVRLWDIRTRGMVHCFSGHHSTVFSLASQAIEPQLISGSADQTIRTWDLRTGKCATVLTHHGKCVRSLAIHPRLYQFVSAAGDALKVWQGANAHYSRDLDPCQSIVNSVAIKDDPESAVVVAGSDDGRLHFWDFQSGRRFQTLETQPQPGSLSSENAIFAAKFDRSETRLITCECDKSVKIWEEDTSETLFNS